MTPQDIYTVASGQAIYAGMNAPNGGNTGGTGATWPTLSAGQFANISMNTLLSIAPTGWPNSDTAGPFINWSSAIYAKDYCPGGAWVVYGSGHLSQGTPQWAGWWAFRLDTLAWECVNRPPAPFLEGSPVNNWAESTDSTILGHPYTPHTYDSLIYQSAANGGGSKGSFLRFLLVGAIDPTATHRWDASASIYTPPERYLSNISYTGSVGYPMTALDEARNGVWLLFNNGNGPLKFVSFADKSITTYPNASFNSYSDHCLTYIPAPYDCLVSVGPSAGVNSNPHFEMYVCPIVGGVPQGFTLATLGGTPPDNGANENGNYHGLQCGTQWSTILSALVSYQGAGDNRVFRCVPPTNPTTGTWTWGYETVAGVGGATPSKSTVTNPNNGLPYESNGSWGRFIEAPEKQCFIYCGSVTGPVQAWRLQGM